MTLYETIKGRTGIPYAHIPILNAREEQKVMTLHETVKGRTGKHDLI